MIARRAVSREKLSSAGPDNCDLSLARRDIILSYARLALPRRANNERASCALIPREWVGPVELNDVLHRPRLKGSRNPDGEAVETRRIHRRAHSVRLVRGPREI